MDYRYSSKWYYCNDAGNFQVFLRLLSLPKKWDRVILCHNMYCPETLSSHTLLQEYTERKLSCGWPKNVMKLTEIESLNKLSLIISIRINKIILKNNNKLYYQKNIYIPTINKIKWKINKDLLSKMKLSLNGKRFTSPIYNDIFCLAICPNGHELSDKGWIRIELILCLLPPNKQ